jgi:hypothetical protein
LVFGGIRDYQSRSPLFDTWALSLGRHPEWTLLDTGSPPPMFGGPAIYDPIRDRVIAFGGVPYTYEPPTEIAWSLPLGDDSRWAPLVGSEGGPTRLIHCSAIYDSKRDRLVAYGGGGPDADSWYAFDDVWELPLARPAWHLLLRPDFHESGFPESRVLNGAVYDPNSDGMVIVGGFIPGAFYRGPFHDVWAFGFESDRWTRLDPGPRPFPLWAEPLAVYDSHRQRMVVVEEEALWALTLGGLQRSRRGDYVLHTASESEAQTNVGLSFQVISPTRAARTLVVEVLLAEDSPATLTMHDLAGRRVWRSQLEGLGRGTHEISIEPERRLDSGVYFLKLVQGQTSVTKKVVTLR